MADNREKIPAVVILMIMLISSVVIYILLVPPPVAYKLLGINNTTTSPGFTVPAGAFFKNISTYIGGYPNPQLQNYPIGTFGVSYTQKNYTVFSKKSLAVSSSLFGSSSYNLFFNNTPSDTYYLLMNVGSVSGSPKLAVSVNGSQIYSVLPTTNESIAIKLPSVDSEKALLSVTNYLNGFAFSQSFTLDNVKLIKQIGNSSNMTSAVKVMTFSGIGDYYLNYTPLGSGNMSVYINGIEVSSISGTNTKTTSVTIPPSVIASAVRAAGSSQDSTVLPLTFNVSFEPGKQASYEIANAGVSYQIPSIAGNKISLYYNVSSTASNYAMVLDVASIINSGNLTITINPSGFSTEIPADKLAVGQNAVILSPSDLGGNSQNGAFTGTVTLSSNGLIIPESITIKPVSS